MRIEWSYPNFTILSSEEKNIVSESSKRYPEIFSSLFLFLTHTFSSPFCKEEKIQTFNFPSE